MENAAYWLVSHALLSLLSYRIHDYQSMDGNTHNGLDPPSPITNFKKTSFRPSHSLILERNFPNRPSLLSDNFSLHQVDIRLASIDTYAIFNGLFSWYPGIFSSFYVSYISLTLYVQLGKVFSNFVDCHVSEYIICYAVASQFLEVTFINCLS